MPIPFTFDPYEGPHNEEGPLAKAHADDAAYDLRAAEDTWVAPGETVRVKTGLRLAIPEGYAGLVLSRSGLASQGIVVANAPGLIDPGYRGEVAVLLHNTKAPAYEIESGGTIGLSWSQPDIHVEKGDRIAQLLFVKTADLNPLYEVPPVFEEYRATTERGEGGFGSTGR